MQSQSLSRLALALLAAGWMAGTGCVSNRYAAASAIGAQPQAIDSNLGGEPLAVKINSVIIYHGVGSWKKEAFWDELIVTVTNVSDQPVTFVAARWVDPYGVAQSAGMDPWLTEKGGLAQKKHYERVGVNFALNALGYTALTYGAVGVGVVAGAGAAASWGGMATGAALGLAAVPVTAVVIHVRNQHKREAIEAEFHRRRWPLPATLQPGESRTASLFFPMTVSPKELVLDWSRGALAGEVRLHPACLTGLHELAPGKPAVK